MERHKETVMDDHESTADLADELMRPKDVAVQQQRVLAWHPILDPNWVIYSFLILAVVMIPLGTFSILEALYVVASFSGEANARVDWLSLLSLKKQRISSIRIVHFALLYFYPYPSCDGGWFHRVSYRV
jgi:hypothetical protein